jgi:hypothetical protein
MVAEPGVTLIEKSGEGGGGACIWEDVPPPQAVILALAHIPQLQRATGQSLEFAMRCFAACISRPRSQASIARGQEPRIKAGSIANFYGLVKLYDREKSSDGVR